MRTSLSTKRLSQLSYSNGATRMLACYELETTKDAEDSFAVFALFEDIHRLRHDCNEVLAQYSREETSIIAATLLIATCVEVIRGLEHQVVEQVAGGQTLSEEDYEPCLSRPKAQRQVDKQIGEDVADGTDDFFFKETYKILASLAALNQKPTNPYSSVLPHLIPWRDCSMEWKGQLEDCRKRSVCHATFFFPSTGCS